MKTRGRISAAALSVVQTGVVEIIPRPKPPAELTAEQRDEWRAIVDRMPADWFPRETHALLADYCRHVVMARRIAQLIAQAEDGETFDVIEYDRLGKMAERESRVIASLATKMRLTQQATYDKSRKKGSAGVRKPWEG